MIQIILTAHVVQSMLHGPVPSASARTRLLGHPDVLENPLIFVRVPNEFLGDPRVVDGILAIGVRAAYPKHHLRTPEENLHKAIDAIATAEPTVISDSISRQRWGSNCD